MNGFEGSIVRFVNKILPQAKDREPILKFLPWWLIVMNILLILLAITQALNDFEVYAAVYVIGIALSVLMIIGGLRMKKGELAGWRLAFYPLLITLVLKIVSLNILGVVFHCFFLYCFIQVRECFGDIS
ncbi:MAG: hypothetical protein P4N41_00445 [Negativicutes bacterium]|nr:hypothetical protein [Negativicutes bacterium]